MPAEDERPKERSNDDAYDDVSIEVHGQQHNEVGNRELKHV